MRTPVPKRGPSGWTPLPDAEDRYSSGIADLDRLLGGGYPKGSFALLRVDDTVGTEDLDLVLFPTYLNFLYHSRGLIAVLPSRDSPRKFRARLTQFVTVRRFDSRVRIVDYVGEDDGPPYVVTLSSLRPGIGPAPSKAKQKRSDYARMDDAERAAQGTRRKSFLELNAFEVIDTLVGSEHAMKMIFWGVKRARHVHNLVIGILGPGLGCEAGVRRLADLELDLHRNEVGLVLRGNRPSFRAHVVSPNPAGDPPQVSFVPEPK